MMTINELHYLIASMGLGLFFTLGLCTLFNHGWNFPYKWYVAVLFYAGLTFVINTPFVDSLCAGSVGISFSRDVLTLGITPFAMLAICKLALVDARLTVLLQVLAWSGLVGMLAALHGLLPAVASVVLLGLLAVTVVVWCVVACCKFFDNGDSEYLKCSDKRWFGHFSIITSVLILAISSVRVFLPYLHIESLMLVIEAMAFFPLVIFFQYQHSDLPFRTEKPEVKMA